MFSTRTKLGIRLLHELEKEKETGTGMTAAELKRRTGIGIGKRDPEWVLRDLKDASLIKTAWKGNSRYYFYSPGTENASLYDLVMAVDSQFTLWDKFLRNFSANFTPEFVRMEAVEDKVDRKIHELLKGIPLHDLLVKPEGVREIVE